MAIEPNIGGSNDGEVIFGCSFVNLSDRALKENVRVIPEEELQETFDAVEPQLFDRIDGGREQIGFVAQDVRLAGSWARRCARRRIWTGESSWPSTTRSSRSCVVKKLQKLVEALEGLRKMAEEEAIGLFQQLARDFNARDLEVPGAGGPRERALAALRSDVARQILASKPRSLGKSAAEEPNDRLQADLIDFSSDWWSRTCSPGRQGPRRSCLQAGGDGDPGGGGDHP